MPCMDGRENEIEEYNRIAIRLACDYCKLLIINKIPIPEYAHDWWKKHQELDLKKMKL